MAEDNETTPAAPDTTATQGQTPGDLPEQSTARAEAAEQNEGGANPADAAGGDVLATEGAQAAPVPTPGSGPGQRGGADRGGSDRGGP
ncbi:MAG: hypothetical protein ACFCVE_13780, partial [Phycisphaerae bacterium]